MAAAALLAVAADPAAAGNGIALMTERPLPVAVADGSVAEVTVRVVPFAPGTATLDPPMAAALDGLLAAVATDCFLFAQAIGHVRPEAEGDADTLAAHRLARARADTLGTHLARAGLPPASVATAWDRQFAVRESRVTLWIYARPSGDECAGTPLPGAPATVAVVPVPDADLEPLRAAALRGPIPVPPRDPPAASAPAPAALPEPELIRADAALAARARLSTGATTPAAARPKAADPAAVAEPVADPLTAAGPPDLPAHAAMAEPSAGPAPAPAPATSPVPAVELVFAADSSELDVAAQARLDAVLADLAAGRAWEIELQAAVADRAGAMPRARALAYNRRLAEQRQARVEEWLGTRGPGPVLRVRRSLVPHDPSRRVLLTARPLP